MADFRLGRLKFKWKGAWNASTAYVIDDIVKYGAYTYVCTTNHTSTAAETTFYSADLSNWSVHTEGIISKGDWAATTWYKIGDVVKYGNTQYRVTNGFTSGATFNATNLVTYVEGLSYENTWVSASTYQKGDIVAYGGYTYSAKLNHTGQTDTPNVDTSNWDVLTVGFESKGEYAVGTTYKPGDVVRYGGNSYVMSVTAAAGTAPTTSANWGLLAEGFNWLGNWASATVYKLGDVVSRTSNSYVCIQAHTNQAPETDTGGVYWNYMSQGGSAAQVLTTTGDLLYQSAGTIARLGLPSGSSGTAAQQAAASGQVLTVGGSPLLPRWETNNTTGPVYYVTKEGVDTQNGKQISRGFASVRGACDYVSALTGADAASVTNPVTIYVKSGKYTEQLPIHVPAYVSIIGDNIRTTNLDPKSGNSDEQDIVLNSGLTHIKLGETVSNYAGTKTAKVLKNPSTTTLTILPITGGAWTTTDKYVDIVDNKHADGSALITSNKEFLAHEAWYKYVADNSANPSGVEATVKARLEAFAVALAYNVRAGSNSSVWDFANATIQGTSITGNVGQDNTLINTIATTANTLLAGNTVSASAGNGISQTAYSGTADTASPKCAQVQSAVTTLAGVFTTTRSAGTMSGTSKTEPVRTITQAAAVPNAESTFIYLADHTIIKDIVLGGLTGFAPDGGGDKDIDTATIKGVYFELDPASPITKSPYVQNVSAIGAAAVGVLVDGSAHAHFDGSPTPSFKSVCFDAFTQVLEGGVGFYCKNTAALEIVSSFTYYHHISYASTGGGKIRAVSGNSSYGKYGCLARGFDANETTIDGTVGGLRLTINPAGTASGTFATRERIQGGTSGAIGQLISNQLNEANYINYIPVKGTFQDNELITGIGSTVPNVAASNATATTKASGAVTGQYGYQLIAEGLGSAPDQGGSIEYVDNGSNNDSSSYVISSSSYNAPDGRGSLTATRAALGSTGATHIGTSVVSLFPTQAVTTTTTLTSTDASTTNIDVSALTSITQNGYIVIDNELMIVTGFVDADTITVTRAQEGTSAATHTTGSAVKVLGAKVASQDTLISDLDATATDVRVSQAGVVFKATDYIKVDNEFMLLSAAVADSTGITILNFADEKASSKPAGDGQSFKTRYRYSQVRLTAHDFLDVGTGNRTTTNWPYLPTQANVPSQEIDEDRPGRVYYVSTDQDGNFSVGDYFKVEQATGKATLNANAFNLTGLDQLQLGAIGATLGAMIDEFSTDGTLAQNSDAKVPTQKAVKTYIDNATGGTTLNTIGNSGTGSVALGTQNLTVQGTANEVETTAANQTLTVGLPNDVTVGNDLTVTNTLGVGGNLTVTGNFTVNGTTTTVATTNTTVSDQLFELGNGRSGAPTGDSGLIIERGNEHNLFIGIDESTDRFRVATSATATGATTGDINDLADIEVQFGNLSCTRLVTGEVIEKVSIDTGSGLNGAANIYLANNSVFFFDTDSASSFGFAVKAEASVNLDTIQSVGESMTFSAITDHGGTAHVINSFTIDGGSNIFTDIHWLGGADPASGDAEPNGSSIYTFTLIKTAANTWRVWGSLAKYKS